MLEGALACLSEQGYAATTARDVVARSGTNLGSIGYHYGSMDRLLTEALLLGFTRFTDEVAAALAGIEDDADRLTTVARTVPAVFERHRTLARALCEAMARGLVDEEVRAGLARDYARGRELVAGLLAGLPPEHPDTKLVGSLVLALFDGLLFMWLLDPENAPDADDLARATAWMTARG